MPNAHTNTLQIASDRRAVVIGGSMAGLLAARVLADHFDRVTILERDTLDDAPQARKGVPQGRHTHGLLRRGQLIIGELFPDLFPSLVEGGSSIVDLSKDMAWHHQGVWKLRIGTGIIIYTQTRPFLEWNVRKRVLAIPTVDTIDNCDVKGFTASPDRKRITGVRIEHGGDRREEDLTAEIVVDASGRGSRTPQWLEQLGYRRPPESVIKVDVGYATRVYRRVSSPADAYKAMMLYPTPPYGTRMGILFPVEGDRWVATVIGWVADYPPSDEAGYLDFARNLEAPDFYNAIKDAEPLSPVMVHKFPSNLRRHYERMSPFPRRLIVLGDALCSFNPSYGQGMTTSALAVDTLRQCLDHCKSTGKGVDAMAGHFRKKVSKVLKAPWLLAAGEDLCWPQTTGPRPFGTRFMNAYFRVVHKLTAHDREVLVRFLRVMNMLDPPHKIFHPRVSLKVAGWTLRSLMSASFGRVAVDGRQVADTNDLR